MNKKKASPIIVGILFAVAAVMIVTGTIGGVKAAPLITNTQDYTAEMELTSIGIQITENTTPVPDGQDLMAWLTKPEFKIGKTYEEKLAVTNTGTINEYVRVSVYKYWTDKDGKDVTLDPGLIILNFVEGDWTINKDESTEERTVLYYKEPIAPGDDSTVFMDSVTIDGKVARAISADKTLDYDGVTFHIQVVADGVQDHNGDAAMTSAWGHTN
ncbi:MAG: hypothetical protein IJH99_08375 [Eubacterium sp.]|nr:hypothetical protein [Eubacterium sp.]